MVLPFGLAFAIDTAIEADPATNVSVPSKLTKCCDIRTIAALPGGGMIDAGADMAPRASSCVSLTTLAFIALSYNW
jgi:hypothetical protein